MKKFISFIKSNSLFVLSTVALFVGTIAATPTTLLGSSQPECPKELLK